MVSPELSATKRSEQRTQALEARDQRDKLRADQGGVSAGAVKQAALRTRSHMPRKFALTDLPILTGE